MNKQLWFGEKAVTAIFAGALLMLLNPTPSAAAASATKDMHDTLDKSVYSALAECKRLSATCKSTADNAVGILVFPNVVKADLIVGGAGGQGALIENGKITGYYNIGAASAGLQAGIENNSQVYVFRSAASLQALKTSPDWKIGASAGVTVVTADANASAVGGDVLAYVFDAKGLNAGVSLDVFDVWKTDQKRPAQS